MLSKKPRERNAARRVGAVPGIRLRRQRLLRQQGAAGRRARTIADKALLRRVPRPSCSCRVASIHCVARSSASTASCSRSPVRRRRDHWRHRSPRSYACIREIGVDSLRRRKRQLARRPGRSPGYRWCLRRSRRCARRGSLARRRSPRHSPCRRAPGRRARRLSMPISVEKAFATGVSSEARWCAAVRLASPEPRCARSSATAVA